MGLLDDAIREHLELKRRLGADPADVERLEREAFGAQGAAEAAPDDAAEPAAEPAEVVAEPVPEPEAEVAPPPPPAPEPVAVEPVADFP